MNCVSRRQVLGGLVAGTAVLASAPSYAKNASHRLPTPPASASPVELARNESFWREVATYYDRTEGIVNLEHGYWGKMAHPVQDQYIAASRMVNAQNSFYGRKGYDADAAVSVRRIAEALGAREDEIVITRNATEAIHNLIRQYQGLRKGDAVLLADVDYPGFKTAMLWLEKAYGVQAISISLPSRASQAQILKLYIEALDANPRLKLMLVTHVSNQHGLVIPVAEIAKQAKRRGIDVICDSAQSWGLIDYKVNELGVDWVGFNLHKWIGSPVGVGALYMRRGSLQKIAPYPGESDPEHINAAARVHIATSNFASVLAIPAALDFHQAIGSANKEARLRHLRRLWTNEAERMSHIDVLGGADEESWTGIGSFRLQGKTSIDDAHQLQQALEQDFGLFTVVRKGLSSGGCVRVTPQVFTSAEEIGRLVNALHRLGT
ncbi:MAG: aminotransferase class V-fold PLP-dependent enzyme [Woeseiaceae bacterium]